MERSQRTFQCFFFNVVFFGFIFFPLNIFGSAFELAKADAEKIGKKIWQNECGGKISGLTSWNKGEEFASLGIGHFIWYPKGKTGVFHETFPVLLSFFRKQKVKLPSWLQDVKECPWQSREEFLSALESEKMVQLRQFLAEHIDLQLRFIVQRVQEALPKIIEAASQEKKTAVRKNFDKLIELPSGIYAIIDYINFKGEGISAKERYQGQGWGLLQVLEGMDPQQKPIDGFILSAKRTLTQRVDNSPPERNEKKWLPGWLNRIDTYKSL